jgi:hypothetical protein
VATSEFKEQMELILGGKIEHPCVQWPGGRYFDEDKVRYVNFGLEKPKRASKRISRGISKAFREVLARITPVPQKGGAILNRYTIEIPSGGLFYAIDFHTDVEGWKRQIEQGSSGLGLLSARIEKGNFIISDGQSVPLADCAIESF